VAEPSNPALYQINARVWLTELGEGLGRPATFDDVPDAELDRLAELGFDWIWLLSVWRTGAAGQRVSRERAEWRREFEETLPDLREADIAGSGFAITGYTAHPALGGDAALARLRARLRKRGLALMLDFVPNHTALDHPWVEAHPEYYVAGSELELARAPANFTSVERRSGTLLLAHGRDPYFAGWPDTLQLDYANPATQEAMIGELARIAERCDGVRCDMAMLVLPDVFERTWARRAPEFWPRAIEATRKRVPDFRFLAEVYWDLEWSMQQLGFDWAYDKRLYDRLREGNAASVRGHLCAELGYQRKLARFLENHDEPRAAASFAAGAHEAAAVLTYLTPGLRFFHQGQLDGRRKRISPHLVRAPREPVDAALQRFYIDLLALLRESVVRTGDWRLLESASAWEGNPTAQCIIAGAWSGADGERRVVAANYAAHQSQCYVRLDGLGLEGRAVLLEDRLGGESYERDGSELATRGLYLDLAPFGRHAFALRTR
jgi:hypothetical protein